MLKLVLIVSVFCFTACQKEELNEIEASENATYRIETKYLNEAELRVENHRDYFLLDGDIMFKKEHLSDRPVALKSTGLTNRRWPNNTMIYSISDDLPNKNRVYGAIQHWESNTNVRFKERTNETDYVIFVPGNGCSSFLGKIGGAQRITLASGCSQGTVIHEIGHAAGLFHEQNRKDRDQYVTINFENVRDGFTHNFQTYIARGMSGAEYSAEFDFNSIMMYGPYFFSKNGKPTITKKDGSTYSINRAVLSDLDIEGIEIMYPSNTGGVVKEKIRVFAFNPGLYTTAYTWDTDNPNPTFWPGEKMDRTFVPQFPKFALAAEVLKWTTIEINLFNNKQETNIIFSQDGASQTADLFATKGYPYFYNNNWYVVPPRLGEFREFSLDVMTMGYTHMYTWDQNGNPTSGEWPGRKMSESLDEWYVGDLFGSATCTNIIFSNNGQNQTADLYVCEDKPYYYNGTFHKYPPKK
ncbi:hypothetical protein GCM10022259_19510 [Aquimarina mytili]